MQNNDDNGSTKDEEVRKDIKTLSARFCDLKERFIKIIHKINEDANGFVDEDESTDDESTDEMSVDEEDNASNSDNDEKQTQEFLIKFIIQSKARRYEYLKHVMEYPKIMKYLVNDNPNCLQISLRYLEPFIKQHIDKNPTGKTYDKINQQILDIRQNYLKNCQ